MGWTAQGSIRGPAGATGPTGASGPPGSDYFRRLTANAPSTSTTHAALTDLTIASLPAGTYALEWNGIYTVNATTSGIRMSINSLATVTAFATSSVQGTTATSSNNTVASANAGTLGAGAGLTTGLPFQIIGTLITTSSGDLQFRTAVAATLQTATVLAGSFVRVARIA